jgi:hypothetical protein
MRKLVLLALVLVLAAAQLGCKHRAQSEIDVDKLPSEFLLASGEPKLAELRAVLIGDAALHEVIARAFPSPSSPEEERRLANDIRYRIRLDYHKLERTIVIRYEDYDEVRAGVVAKVLAQPPELSRRY